MTEDPAIYWSEFEKATGEKVAARSIGERLGDAASPGGDWGLVILTDAALRFRHLPSERGFLGLFKRQASAANKDEAYEIIIPRDSVKAFNAPRRGFLARIFSSPFPCVSVTAEEEGQVKVHRFTVDPTSGILKALEKAFEDRALEPSGRG
jgi:hypothetical protein